MIPLTPWVKRLLAVNFIIYFVVPMGSPLYARMAFFPSPEGLLLQPWSLVSYQFLHGNFAHIAFNMLALFFFGPRLEERMGGGNFLALYLLSGVGGALLSLALPAETLSGFGPRPIVGASGAVYGVLAAYAAIWPKTVIYIWAVLPIQAWALALIMVAVSLYYGLAGGGGNVAHLAHLGGIAVGYGYLKWWDWRLGAAKRDFKRKLEAPLHEDGGGVAASVSTDKAALSRWEGINVSTLHELNREHVESLLAKARAAGVKALTPAERQFLDRMV